MVREKRKQREQNNNTTKDLTFLRTLRFLRTNNMFNICVYLRSSVD
jgi:hypothetical protein